MNKQYLTNECDKFFLMANVLKNREEIFDGMMADAIYDEVYCEEVCPERQGFKYPNLTVLIYKYGIDYVLNIIESSGHEERIIEKLIDATKTADKEIKELKDFGKELYDIAIEIGDAF